MDTDTDKALVVFQGKEIRRTWHNEEWWFVLEDIVFVLTDSKDSKQYIQRMKQRDEPLAEGWVQIVHTLPVDTVGGKQIMNCVNTEGAFRLIQSIPSKKAEPFKRWLAKVGYERIQEIENPELAQARAKEYYKLKGYPKDWIEKRVRGIAIRQELTDEWVQRGVKEEREYAILTNEISTATFGVPIKKHKQIKGLDPKFKNQNLRDHMTDLELIFSMLGEASTTEIARNRDARGFVENRQVARKGGEIAGGARRKLEYETGRKVVSSDNYLEIAGKVKKIGNTSKSKYKKNRLTNL
ncbi:MAG: phage antirepressor protein [Candidatus Altiarchaeales archaeon IMC4]|nr:MAG: phage antirepressor protein [Candidatus Altiarchaeales archaeon IMC4]